MIFSTVLSEQPLIEGNSVTLAICRAGTKAYDEKGNEYTITQGAIDSSAETYSGGIITVNHKVKEKGKIAKSWQDGEFIKATVDGLSQDCVDAINSKAYRGVSQESTDAVFSEDNKTDIVKLKGTGVTFVFYPEKPACPLNKGCGVPVASTLAAKDTDYERHEFDVAIENNTSKIVKVREISIYIDQAETDDEDILKRRILHEVMFIGAGQYLIFDRDTSLGEGDEIQEGREPVHTVTITVSMLQSFNFPLNTTSKDSDLDIPGGIEIADQNTDELKSTISQLEGDNKDLKSTINDLQQELKKKDEEIPGKIESAIKVALETDRVERAKQADLDAAVEELKSCVSEELAEEYLKTEPTAAMIRSTIAIKKAEAGKQIGASGGQSPEGDGKITSTYQAGKEMYEKMGVTPEDIEKHGGLE